MQKFKLRQVLKWTNVYGYYLPEDKHNKRQLSKFERFVISTNLKDLSHPELIHLIAICNAGQKSLGQQKRNSIKSMVVGPTSQLMHELDVSSRT